MASSASVTPSAAAKDHKLQRLFEALGSPSPNELEQIFQQQSTMQSYQQSGTPPQLSGWSNVAQRLCSESGADASEMQLQFKGVSNSERE